MNSRNRAISIVLASRKRNLELARQIMKIRMPQQIPRHAQSIGRHVERFPRANTRHRASRNVPHRIPASLSRSESRIGKQPHRRADIFQFHKMKLNVFPCREVPTPRRILIRNIRQYAKLRRLQHTRRDLHAQHLETRLPLPIRSMLQAKRPKLLRRDGAALQLSSALFKTNDLRFDRLSAVPFFNLR
jgi:hypothetical protein